MLVALFGRTSCQATDFVGKFSRGMSEGVTIAVNEPDGFASVLQHEAMGLPNRHGYRTKRMARVILINLSISCHSAHVPVPAIPESSSAWTGELTQNLVT
jgi:hypothetical protein